MIRTASALTSSLGRLDIAACCTIATCCAVALACAGPLPPENPQTELAQRPEPVPIEVTSTQDSSAPPGTPSEPSAVTPSAKIVYEGIGLATPESVLYDAAADRYLVSNINGSPLERDGNGFISVLSPDGSLVRLDFIQGGRAGVELHAPKGLLIVGSTLYVADIDTVRAFDLSSGAPQSNIAVPGATFLNELAADPAGSIYVTDSGLRMGTNGLEPNGTEAIYKLVGSEVTTFAKGTQLSGPNGIFVDESVWIVSFGSNTLTSHDAKGNVTSTTSLPTGGLDGLVALADGSLLVSSWQGEAVYHGRPGETFRKVVGDVKSPADIGFDSKRQRVLIPLFTQNQVWAVPLTGP